MSKLNSIKNIKKEVLKKVLPDKEEQKRASKIANKIKKEVTKIAKNYDLECEVTIEGSFAKNTWLKKEADIDIFMQVPKTLEKRQLRNICLDVARASVKNFPIIERYAEHPYIETSIDGYTINIVPCYKCESNQWISAVDRTPFHTEYMKNRLNDNLRNEIRIIKKFMKATGTYSAEIKVGGFSGMLCEILVLFYGSFDNLLHSASDWKDKEIIDIENFYDGSVSEILDLFNEPLIVIDPVDRNRNVASAVTEQKLWEFVSASRAFIDNPRIEFFFPLKQKIIPMDEIRKKIIELDSTFLFLKFGKIDAVVDVIWSQLYKSERCIKKSLKGYDFNVLRSRSWSDENDLNIIVFELEMDPISNIKKHLGPQIFRKSDSINFLNKHKSKEDTILGPWIENDKWVVEKRRNFNDSQILLKFLLADGGERIGVAKFVSKSLKNGFSILRNEEILDIYESNLNFAKFLDNFFEKKHFWLY